MSTDKLILESKLALNSVTHNEAIVIAAAAGLIGITICSIAYICIKYGFYPRKGSRRMFGERF